ncbi:MAG: flippase-like domain-containing protein [Deltaproteobacteria bacterium]|nr:MAG: flippase-like domain-containing protein [Deltaproteobacteria bacterium]
MRKSAYLLLLAGLALFTVLIGYHGLNDVIGALAVAGWGLVWVSLFHVLPLAVESVAWGKLWHSDRPSLLVLLWACWIGEAVNGLLPVAQVGGDLIRARLLVHRNISGAMAGASVVVEVTISVFTLIIFSLLGVWLLLDVGGQDVVLAVLIGLGILGSLMTAFYLAQRRGLFARIARALVRLAGDRDWDVLVGGAAALDQAILGIYQDRHALFSSSVWRLVSWLVGTGEVWLAMYFLGAPVSLTHALLLESLGQAIRAAAFLIPGALGVQEGGYLVLGSLLGISPQVALALSLTKRVRYLLLGLPALVAWQIAEGRRLWRGRSEPVQPAE